MKNNLRYLFKNSSNSAYISIQWWVSHTDTAQFYRYVTFKQKKSNADALHWQVATNKIEREEIESDVGNTQIVESVFVNRNELQLVVCRDHNKIYRYGWAKGLQECNRNFNRIQTASLVASTAQHQQIFVSTAFTSAPTVSDKKFASLTEAIKNIKADTMGQNKR